MQFHSSKVMPKQTKFVMLKLLKSKLIKRHILVFGSQNYYACF